MAKENKRLLSLDILRGITIAGMLLVNNPGTWEHIYAPLEHAEWIGLTPTDLVFPFFMFVMGVSMYFSLSKFKFEFSSKVFLKILKRTIILFLIGWMVQWFGMWLRGLYDPESHFFDKMFGHLRILGVFQRLALVYFFGSMIAILFKTKFIPWIIGIILVAYAFILGFGHGYEFSSANILSRIDCAVLGEDHMYHESAYGIKLALDPEGILSTLPCIAHVLIGFMVGNLLTKYRDNRERVVKVATLGIALLLAGWLLQYGIPCSKKAWTSSYTLITTGMASCILALLVFIIDIKGREHWCRFFQSFGVNPLFCYLLGTILAIVFSAVILHHSSDYRPADNQKAVSLYKEAVKQGLPQAHNNLAVAYYQGNGVDADTTKAKELFNSAIEKGLNEARFNLALVYMDEGNSDKALPLLKEAADSAINDAQFNLALIYDYGLMGCTTNHDKARKLYAEAAGEGNSRAMMALEQANDKENGLTEVFSIPKDLLIKKLYVCKQINDEANDTITHTSAIDSFNQALEASEKKGQSTTIHTLLHDMCKWITCAERDKNGEITARNPEAASCLYAILFVLITWCFGYILYRKKIYIKI
ncbi:MAG: SEL1-like repeat protein [Muribaculaceae bacterium]|nr:SEL1-like repeat protein [Muribaculaceae bacterium]